VWALVRLGNCPDDIIRFKLSTPLYDCQEAQAVVLRAAALGGLPCEEGAVVAVSSPLGLVAAYSLAEDDGQGNLCAPAGHAGYARRFADTGKYEAFALGPNVCCGQDSSSGSPSDSSKSPSESESGSPSGSQPSASQPSGSDKSTAIVPASWTPGGYTALFTLESPEVRFDDVLTAEVSGAETRLPIDPKYLEVCAPGTVEVCGCVPNRPVLIGAAVEDGAVVIRLFNHKDTKTQRLFSFVPSCLCGEKKNPPQPLRVVIRLTGIRKGFADHRFPDRTRRQFLANERFIKSAYPGA
jgi:hypothetical protein